MQGQYLLFGAIAIAGLVTHACTQLPTKSTSSSAGGASATSSSGGASSTTTSVGGPGATSSVSSSSHSTSSTGAGGAGGGMACVNDSDCGGSNDCRVAGAVGCDPSGACVPRTCVSIASGRPHPQGLAVGASDVYWTEIPMGTSGSLQKCPKAGCNPNPSTLTSSADAILHAVALDPSESNVFWMDGTGVYSCPVGGCSNNLTTISNHFGQELVVDATSVYWTLPMDGTVRRCPVVSAQPS
jgi:hypothetical protein